MTKAAEVEISQESRKVKKIRNSVIMNPFTGAPLDVTYDFRRTPDGKVVKDDLDQPVPIKTVQTTALAMRTFISGFSPKDSSLEDCDHALRVLDAIRPFRLLEQLAPDWKAPDHIVLEDAEHSWLISKYKERGVSVHGVPYASLYLRAFEDIVKEAVEEPKAAKPRLVGSK